MKSIILRILSLCLVLLLSPLLAFCSRDPTRDTEPEGARAFDASINFSGYAVVRGERAGKSAIAAAVRLRNALESATGINIKINDDWIRPGDNTDYSQAYEILVGQTNRPESAEASALLEKPGYIIKIIGNKIVIAASSDALLDTAVDFFINTYLSKASPDGVIELYGEYVMTDFEFLPIVQNGGSEFTLIRSENADYYTITLLTDLGNKIRELTGVQLKLGTDWTKTGEGDSRAYEVLLGNTSRSETRDFLSTLEVDEYGIGFIGRKVVVAGWTPTTTALAKDKFISILSAAAEENQKTGTRDILLPATGHITAKYDGWVTDFPELSGGVFSGAYDAGVGALEYYYTGATKDAYLKYRAEIEAAGYKNYHENQIGDNLFATYTKGDVLLHTYYVAYEGAVRVITEPLGDLPKLSEDYIKTNEPSITAVPCIYENNNKGQCQIIRLSDGSFFIIDSNSSIDGTGLYNALVELNGGEEGITIAAWFFSHGHGDHYGGFTTFAKDYGSKVKLESVIINATSFAAYEGTRYQPTWDFAGTHIHTYIAMFGSGIKLIKPHTGYKFAVRDAVVEVLYTHDDLYPNNVDWYNDVTTVIRVTLAGQTIMFLGDLMDSMPCKIIASMYSREILKSDIMQVAHHGDGGSVALYDMIDPAVLVFPCSEAEYQRLIVKNAASRYIINSKNVRKIIISDNGIKTLTLPYIIQ